MVVATSATLVKFSAGISTVTLLAQRGSVLPTGQLLPGVVEVTVAVSAWLPVSGSLHRDRVGDGRAWRRSARSPVQVSVGLVKATVPGGGGGVAVVGRVVQDAGQRDRDARHPTYGGLAGVGDRDGVGDDRRRESSWLTSAALVMVSCGILTGTVVVHAGLRLPTGQVLPAAAEVATVVRVLLPRSGLFTVTEPVIGDDRPDGQVAGPDQLPVPALKAQTAGGATALPS